jgi:hypothetical protein
VDVGPEGLDRKFNIANTAQAEILHGRVTMIYTAKFPDAGVGFKSFHIFLDETMQVNTACFLFTFNNEFDIAWKFAF